MLRDTGAEGVGLFRTELQFMIASHLPKVQEQIALYREAIRLSEGKPIVFRLLDVGGDKVIPYLRAMHEENPAMGFRSLRLALERPGLLRTQVRALLTAADGAPMKILVPMVTETWEFVAAKRVIQQELERLIRSGAKPPSKLEVGAMIEVPSLLFELDHVLPEADFVSIGSNDLIMFMTAADRANTRVAKAYDPIALPRLRALRHIVDMARRYNVPITMCGELAGRTVEAMALLAIGMTRLSMSPPSIGPIKEMIMGMELKPIRAAVAAALGEGPDGRRRRELLRRYCRPAGPGDLTMAGLPEDKLIQLEKRFDSVEAALAAGPAAEAFVKLSKEYAELEPVVRPIIAWRKTLDELRAAEELAGSGDRDMAAMANAEIEELKPQLAQMESEIRILLLPKDSADEKNVILEIRAGTGGDEAALFAGDLLRMYQRYADLQGWKLTMMEESAGRSGRLQGSHRQHLRPRRLCAAQVRIRRAPRAARAGNRSVRAASTRRRRRLRCCPRSRTSTSRSATRISASTRCARRARAASTSTRPTRRCASRICRPASW